MIIGPFTDTDWNTLVLLKSAIKWYSNNNVDNKFSNAIRKDTEVYNCYLSKYGIR